MRRDDLVWARANGWKLADLAAEVGVSPGRIWQITTPKGAGVAAPTAGPPPQTTTEGTAAGTGETHPAVAATTEGTTR